MQIIDISEPGEFDAREELVVGIDFGTTNSLIAVSKNSTPEIIPMQDGSQIVPSIIAEESDSILVGNEAKNAKNKIRSIKRLLAKSFNEIRQNKILANLAPNIIDDDVPRIKLLDNNVTLAEAASEIFKYLKNQAEISLKQNITKAVVSVPAYFDDAARGQVLFSAKLAGLEVIRLIAEPTAAAYAYGLSKSASGSYLVYDFGGGTFDVSVLNMQDGVFQVLSSGGDNLLGGDDIDYAIAEYICKENDLSITDEMIAKAKSIKELFTTRNNIVIKLEDYEFSISKEQYEQIVSPIINRTVKIAQNVLDEAQLEDLDGIILVGGSSRIDLISKKLNAVFRVKIYNNIDPDKIIAYGAALQAENLTSKQNSLLIDVAPLSIGLELYGGVVEKIIMRNTPIPFSITKEFTTYSDNQTGIKFHIVQGEREIAKDCRSLANFELTDIKPAKAGRAKIQVTFAIDADGLLSISARDTDTGKTHNVEIKPSYGIDDEYINTALQQAYENAASDHKKRLLIEARESGKNLITGLQNALKETPDILDNAELKKIENAINSLQKSINSDNRDMILLETNKLNNLAENFIQKHLDKGAELFLKNHHIDEIKFEKNRTKHVSRKN